MPASFNKVEIHRMDDSEFFIVTIEDEEIGPGPMDADDVDGVLQDYVAETMTEAENSLHDAILDGSEHYVIIHDEREM